MSDGLGARGGDLHRADHVGFGQHGRAVQFSELFAALVFHVRLGRGDTRGNHARQDSGYHRRSAGRSQCRNDNGRSAQDLEPHLLVPVNVLAPLDRCPGDKQVERL